MLSYDQCVQLRDANFPQPEKEWGQIWANKSFMLVITDVNEDGVNACDWLNEMYSVAQVDRMDLVYCPTVEDMLSLLKPTWRVGRFWGEGESFVMTDLMTNGIVYRDESLIKILQLAWIEHREFFEDTAGSKPG